MFYDSFEFEISLFLDEFTKLKKNIIIIKGH